MREARSGRADSGSCYLIAYRRQTFVFLLSLPPPASIASSSWPSGERFEVERQVECRR